MKNAVSVHLSKIIILAIEQSTDFISTQLTTRFVALVMLAVAKEEIWIVNFDSVPKLAYLSWYGLATHHS